MQSVTAPRQRFPQAKPRHNGELSPLSGVGRTPWCHHPPSSARAPISARGRCRAADAQTRRHLCAGMASGGTPRPTPRASLRPDPRPRVRKIAPRWPKNAIVKSIQGPRRLGGRRRPDVLATGGRRPSGPVTARPRKHLVALARSSPLLFTFDLFGHARQDSLTRPAADPANRLSAGRRSGGPASGQQKGRTGRGRVRPIRTGPRRRNPYRRPPALIRSLPAPARSTRPARYATRCAAPPPGRASPPCATG